MNKTILLTGIGFAFLAVILGAFGSHGLRELVNAQSMSAYKTAVEYQMYHALLLIILGGTDFLEEGGKKAVFYFMTFGILLFSFSLYTLAIANALDWDLGVFGIITPIGGSLLIIGWFLLAIRVFRRLA
ncbi:MAG: DUF423 domain-containing protein [Flavobacteriaceae bacterium]|nr:DUF423 domain-containing protein [Flavobacteriaceae bacterium]